MTSAFAQGEPEGEAQDHREVRAGGVDVEHLRGEADAEVGFTRENLLRADAEHQQDARGRRELQIKDIETELTAIRARIDQLQRALPS